MDPCDSHALARQLWPLRRGATRQSAVSPQLLQGDSRLRESLLAEERAQFSFHFRDGAFPVAITVLPEQA